uniref:CSON010230 protein n=1 Tax=Culicoides sonorensis TaxID=179676 RepID=A0A336N384_CULSO
MKILQSTLKLTALFILALGATDIIVTNHPRCTEMAKNYILNHNVTPPELAIIISVCEGIVNPQYSGFGGGFLATIFNGYCANYNIDPTRVVNAREKAPSNFVPNAGEFSEIGVPGTLKGFSMLYDMSQRMRACGVDPKLEWKDLFTENIKLAETGWNETPHYKKNWHELGNAPHPFISIAQGKIKNEKLANTLRDIANEGPYSSLYRPNGFFHRTVMNELRSVNSQISSNDILAYDVPARYADKNLCFNYTIIGSDLPGSGASFVLGCKIVEAAYGTLQTLTREERTLFMYHVLRYMYSLKPHLKSANVQNVLQRIYGDASKIANYILNSFDKPWSTEPIKKFGSFVIHENVRHKREHGTTNIVIRRGKFAVTMTSTINYAWGSKLSSSLGFFYNNQLKDFDDVGSPNEPRPNSTPQSSTSAMILYSKKLNPVLQIGAAGGSKMIGSIFNTFFNYIVNNMTLVNANNAPRCMPFYRNKVESVYCEKEISRALKNKFKDIGKKIVYATERFGGVTASSTFRKKPEAAFDERRDGSVYINPNSNFEASVMQSRPGPIAAPINRTPNSRPIISNRQGHSLDHDTNTNNPAVWPSLGFVKVFPPRLTSNTASALLRMVLLAVTAPMSSLKISRGVRSSEYRIVADVEDCGTFPGLGPFGVPVSSKSFN